MSSATISHGLPVIQANGVGVLGAAVGVGDADLRGLRPEPRGDLMLVGELARATGKSVRALHLYEALGLLKPQNRSKGRYRQFLPDSVVRVRWISKLQSLGFSLSDIQELVRAQEESGSAAFAAQRLRDTYAKKLEDTRGKLHELRQLERELQQSLDYLQSCHLACVPDEQTEACSACSRHTEPQDTPDLVAGLRAP